MKLTTRLSDPAQIDRIRRLLSQRTSDLNVEIQQRAVEYGNLFNYDDIRRGVLERMPPPEIREEQRVLGEATPKQKKAAAKAKKPSKQTEQDLLLDLMGGSDLPAVDMSATMNGTQKNADLLADILGGGSSASTAPIQSPAPTNNAATIMDLFNTNGAPNGGPASQPSADLVGGFSSPSPTSHTQISSHAHTAFDKDSLLLTLSVQRNAGQAQILARFRNQSNFDRFTGVGLQAAVPKSQKLQLQGISKSELDGGEEATQGMRVVGVSGVSIIQETLGNCKIILIEP